MKVNVYECVTLFLLKKCFSSSWCYFLVFHPLLQIATSVELTAIYAFTLAHVENKMITYVSYLKEGQNF